MPKLKEDEWDKILQHISIISFLQGLNIGGKVYNGYSIITNTKNKEVVSEDSIYLVDSESASDVRNYYKFNEKEVYKHNLGVGVLNIDLEKKSIKLSQGGNSYYYPVYALGSYDSIINQNNVEDINDNIYEYFSNLSSITDAKQLISIYFTALGRERYTMYKTEHDYVKLKNDQYMP